MDLILTPPPLLFNYSERQYASGLWASFDQCHQTTTDKTTTSVTSKEKPSTPQTLSNYQIEAKTAVTDDWAHKLYFKISSLENRRISEKKSNKD